MLAQITEELARSLGEIVPGSEIRLDLPRQPPAGPVLSLYPLAFAPAPPAASGSARSAGLACLLRFLVTVWDSTPAAELALWDRLLAGLVGLPGLLPDFAPPSALWATLGLPPRPALCLSRPAAFVQPAPAAPRVRETVVALSPLGRLAGRVVDRQGRGIARAEVALADGARRTEADAEGRFTLAGVPAGAPRRVQVSAHGLTTLVTLDPAAPGTVTLPLPEE